jgi:hypothetical protein
MRRLAKYALATLAAIFVFVASINWPDGDLRFGLPGNKTMRGWTIVDSVRIWKPACAGGFVRSGGGATTYTLTGPTTDSINSPATYTVQPVGSLSTPSVVTPADLTHHCSFTPTTVTMSGAGAKTFTCTAFTSGSGSLATTNSTGLTDPSSLSVSIPNLLSSGYPGFTGGSPWVPNDVTLATAGASDPFGGSNTATITEDGAASFHFLQYVSLTLTANQSYTLSVIAKPGTGTRNVQPSICDNTFTSCLQAIFDPAVCSFVADSSAGNAGITSSATRVLSGGWCLVQLSGSIGAFTSAQFAVSLMNGTTGNYTGDGSSSLNIYGAVLE